MVWMCLAAFAMCLFVVVLYCALVVASDADDQMEAEAERHMTDVTPIPVEPKVTYPVPLDQELQDYIVQTCLDYEISPCIVFAIIGVESNFYENLVGDDGHSFGLMQIYKECHLDRMDRLGVTDLTDPKQNVLVGVDFFAELMDERKGIEWALMAYNAGQTRADEYVRLGILTDYARCVKCNAEQIYEGRRISER